MFAAIDELLEANALYDKHGNYSEAHVLGRALAKAS
jgi:hypothetical protein